VKKIEELDFARVVAMLSVIMIHVTSTYIYVESRYMIFGMNIAFILNQLSRFAVPMFILLSGASLGLSRQEENCLRFYKKRFLKIGIPYLIWFTVYYFYNYGRNFKDAFAGGLDSVLIYLKSLLLGQSASHLYFIVILIQLYLLYPLLKRAVDRAPRSSVILSFIVTVTIQVLYLLQNYNMNYIPGFIRPYLWLLFPTWLFYFAFGMSLNRKWLVHIRKKTSKNTVLILGLTLLFAVAYVFISKATGMLDSIKASLNLYTVLVLLSSFGLWKYIGRCPAVQKAVDFLAQHSMTVYFNHILILYFFRRFAVFSKGMLGMLLLYASVLIAAVILAVIIDGLQSFIRRVFVPPEKSKISM
jgi:surface polysaccharide O-acyltransferase-like enzyme